MIPCMESRISFLESILPHGDEVLNENRLTSFNSQTGRSRGIPCFVPFAISVSDLFLCLNLQQFEQHDDRF